MDPIDLGHKFRPEAQEYELCQRLSPTTGLPVHPCMWSLWELELHLGGGQSLYTWLKIKKNAGQ